MSKFFKIVVGTEFCGTDQTYVATANNKNDLLDLAYSLAYENAEGYDYLVWGGGNGPDDVGVSEEEFYRVIEEYYENATADIQEIAEQEYNECLKDGVENALRF